MCSKTEREIRSALQETGLSWSLESGKKHIRIFLGGRQVGVLSRGNKAKNQDTGIRNLLAGIRRSARAHGQAV